MAGELLPAREETGENPLNPRLAGGRIELRCPRCRGVLADVDGRFECVHCAAAYGSVDGVPVMSNLSEGDAGAEYKLRQMEFFDAAGAEFEITRPKGQPRLYGWLISEKFRRSVRGVESRLVGATVLTVCGGSGMDAEFLARCGATVVVSDLSLGAVQRAAERGRRAGLSIDAVVADVEHLPFADRSVDIVYVHDGLHHLSDPMLGLTEMCRVAREHVLLTEPSRAVATEIAARLGIALREEYAGNRVERISSEVVRARLAASAMIVSGADRYAMYYQHEPGWAMSLFSRSRTFPVARIAVIAFNLLLGRVGNKLSVRATRQTTEGRT